MNNLPDILAKGEPARLIPVVADTRKEQRATSALLAVIGSVVEYGRVLLSVVGTPVGKTSRIRCFTEVEFKSQPKEFRQRPDGLIQVRTGKRIWSAIVEAKVGNAVLDAQQIEAYLDIARLAGADAVITISNQFAARPTHHPVTVSKRKLGKIGLYHWSWTFLLTQAVIEEGSKGVEDPDQAFILNELIRYLDHESSGVTGFDRMPATWKDLCASVQHGTRLTRSAPEVVDAATSWHGLTRFIALKLSVGVGREVSVYLSRSHAKDADQRLHDDVAALATASSLQASFDVPDAADRVHFSADLARRTLTASMTLQAPKDRKLPKALFTWIFRQIEDCPDDSLMIIAKWPGRSPDTSATLAQMREDRNVLLSGNAGQMPASFEIRQVSDLGGRFRGVKTFVEDALRAVTSFYEEVGQHLEAWVPKPPKIKPESVLDGGAAGQPTVPGVIGRGPL